MQCARKSEREIEFEILQGSLRNELGKALLLQPLKWEFVPRILFGINLYDSRFCWDAIKFVFDLFEKYKCNDLPVIGEVLLFACSLFGHVPIPPDMQADCDGHYFRCEWVSRHIQKTFVSLMTIPYGNQFRHNSICLDVAYNLIKNGRDELLSALLRYGFICLPFKDEQDIWNDIENILSHHFYYSFPHLKIQKAHHIFQVVKHLPPEVRRRMLTVFKGVEIILRAKTHPVTVQKSVKCLRMVFESIPEPIITLNEIETFLELIVDNASLEYLPQISNDYVSQFPESDSDLTPRSLLHLSRCQVRQNLRSVHALPYGVESLPIAQRMKNYILLHLQRTI